MVQKSSNCDFVGSNKPRSDRYKKPMNDKLRELDDNSIRALILSGESETIEFKTRVPEPSLLARLIAAFANASGGVILIGIQEPDEIVGTNPQFVLKVWEISLERMEPRPRSTIQEVSINGKTICVIHVDASDTIVMCDSGAFIRVWDRTQAMTPAQVTQKLIASQAHPDLGSLGRAIARQSKIIEDLQEELKKTNTWRSKLRDYLIGGVIGALIGYLLSILL